jgi:hypothetical protein
MTDYKNPGINGFDGPSSITPNETTALAAVTCALDPELDRIKRVGAAMVDRPDAEALPIVFGSRDRNTEPTVKILGVLNRK